jgi:hypothetical protein
MLPTLLPALQPPQLLAQTRFSLSLLSALAHGQYQPVSQTCAHSSSAVAAVVVSPRTLVDRVAVEPVRWWCIQAMQSVEQSLLLSVREVQRSTDSIKATLVHHQVLLR